MAHPLCVDLDDASSPTSRALLGGKGYHLARLSQLSLPVPPAFAITTEAFLRSARATLRAASSLEHISQTLASATIPNAVDTAIRDAYTRLLERSPGPVAVRSSGTAEDSAAASFAGQQHTVLNVRDIDALFDALRQVWASLFSPASLLYRGRVRLDEAPPTTAVVVQTMIDASVAGVLFTLNPIDHDPTQALVCSAYGLGETVVGGQSVDTFYLQRRNGSILRSDIGDKHDMLVMSDAGGLHTRSVPPEQRSLPSLSPTQLAQLIRVGDTLERALGCPQDIEFAFTEDAHLHLLQTRPITGLQGQDTTTTGATTTVYSNINVGEALPGVGTPMTWSIIRAFTRRGFETAFGALGLDVPPHYDLAASFRGRVFLNISEFVSVASQIPLLTGHTLVRLGGATAPPNLDETTEQLSPLAFLLRLPLTIPRLLTSQLGAPRIAARWAKRFTRARRDFFDIPLSTRSRAELLPVLEQVDDVFNRTGEVMLASASNFLMSYVVVTEMLSRVGGPEAARKEAILFSGLTRVRSAAPGLELLSIARFVKDRPALRAAFEHAMDQADDPADIDLTTLPDGAGLLNKLGSFLEHWGHRAPREAEIATPRWREDPSFLLAVLRRHLQAPYLPTPREIEGQILAQRREATQLIRQHFFTGLGLIFRALLRWAQRNARLREELRAYVVDTLSMYRHIFLEIGRRLARSGHLAERDDVFFLTYPEVRAWLETRNSGADFRYAVAARRAAFQAYVDSPDPPEIFTLARTQVQPLVDEVPPIPANAERLIGLSGAPGRVTGPARVLRDLDNANLQQIQPGEILVASFTDVGWTPLFLVAGGVVTDRGGPLSHSCVVAREYGIPCVVNTRVATELIQDGEILTVDGESGVVYRSPS